MCDISPLPKMIGSHNYLTSGVQIINHKIWHLMKQD